MKKQQISKLLALAILATTITGTTSFAQGNQTSQRESIINSIRVSLDKSNDFFKGKVKSFRDMGTHWSDITIGKLVDFGVISGYKDGTFKPNNTITRAEFSSMINHIFKLESEESLSFEDTKGHWSKDAISALLENEIIISSEYGEKYEPNKEITRIEMAKMIVRAMELNPSSKQGQNTKFADDKDIKSADKAYIILATENKIIGGYPDNTFKPNQTATRAEASTMLVNMMHVLGNVEHKPVEKPKSNVNKAEYLPKVSFEEAGISRNVVNDINRWTEKPVENVIKGDVNQFPLELGNVVITGIEFADGKIAKWNGSDLVIVHGYAVRENDKNGMVSGYSQGELRIGIIGKSGQKSIESSIVLERQNVDLDYIRKSYPNAVEGYTTPLNQPFTAIYVTDIKHSSVEKIVFVDSAYSPTSDVLEIKASQIKKN